MSDQHKTNLTPLDGLPKSKKHVALAYPLVVPFMGALARGVMEYAKEHGDWIVTTSPPPLIGAGEKHLTLKRLEGWPGDAIYTVIRNEKDVSMAKKLKIPVVNGGSTLLDTSNIPRVRPDHYAMGRMAAEHLLERGIKRLAYYGLDAFWFSHERCRGFAECADEAGVECKVLQEPKRLGPRANWQARVNYLSQWLTTLQTPVGLLAVQDHRARVAIEECQRLGLHVPHDVAVIGMDDDPMLCTFSHPTLSSVSRSPWEQGYRTAEVLDQVMQRRDDVIMDTIIEPDGVVARESTDTIAVDDVKLNVALHFIHANLSEPFGVDRIVQATTMSRRQLEIRFQNTFGCSPLEYVSRRRVELAKKYLMGPEKIKFHKIAMFCGFSSVQQMRLIFRRVIDMTPQEYRQSKK